MVIDIRREGRNGERLDVFSTKNRKIAPAFGNGNLR